jgi:hypothetical protein
MHYNNGMNFDIQKSEEYWRAVIAEEILVAINSGSEINAYGAYLLAKGNK